MSYWAYAAERDGRCYGVIASDVPDAELKRFYRDFAGFEIKTMRSRADWDAYCKRVPFGKPREADNDRDFLAQHAPTTSDPVQGPHVADDLPGGKE